MQTKAETNAAGLYNVTHLNPGEYTVRVEANGFQRFAQQHVVLQVDSTARVDSKLQVGGINQEVTVTAGAATIETQKTDVNTTITTQREVENIPTVNRLPTGAAGSFSDGTRRGRIATTTHTGSGVESGCAPARAKTEGHALSQVAGEH